MASTWSKRGYVKRLQLLKEVFSYICGTHWYIWGRIVLSIICTLVVIALNIAVPLVLRSIVDALPNAQQQQQALIIALLVSYGSLWTLSRATNELREIILFRVLERGIRVLSLKLFEQLHTLSLSFHLDRKTGSIISAIDRIHKAVPDVVWSFIVIVPTTIEITITMMILWHLYGMAYGIVLLAVLVFSFAFSMLALTLITPFQRRSMEAGTRAHAFIVDSILNFETVKCFGNEGYEAVQCDHALRWREQTSTKLYVLRGCIGLGQVIILGSGLLFVTIKSGYSVLQGLMTVGDFIVINSYLLQFAGPFLYLNYVMRQVNKGLSDLENAMNLLHTRPEIVNVPNARSMLVSDQVRVTFENVSFWYNARAPILKNISFTVEAGKMVAIVGATGAGKSTISRLMFRFYEATEGRILINDQNIRLVTHESLRSIIGIVPQDTMMFNNTIYYNVLYGRPTATREEVERAIALAHLNHFISLLPDGCDTVVGERGLKLSGGERQRVAIARVILKNPKIFIFDEATSALDIMTERRIQKNLEEISRNATTVVVAHRLATVVRADEIIVIDQGRIVQKGSHAQLLQEREGMYARMWQKQIFGQT